jgi:hypothetical protein
VVPALASCTGTGDDDRPPTIDSMRRPITRLRPTDDLTRVLLVAAALIVLVAVLAVAGGSPSILGGVSNGIDLPTPAR